MHPAPRDGALATALWLLDEGFWPIAIAPNSKRPIQKYWGTVPPTGDRLVATYDRHKEAGVGFKLGPAVGLVDLEIDEPEEAAAFLAAVQLPETLGWTSARGTHSLFKWDSRLNGLLTSAVAHLPGCELRAGGPARQTMSVCPPSVGTDGRPRAWNGCQEIAPLPESLLGEIELRSVRRAYDPADRQIVSSSRYAAAALHYEAEAVADAQVGTRNRTLVRAAFSLGQLVATGLLSRGTVEVELTVAALAAGLREGDIAATLRSGLDAGMANPRGVRRRG
jgi:hypothetical protein